MRQNGISHYLERPYESSNSPHTVGVAYFVVFGSQNDVLWAWCFWRKDDTGTRTTADSGALILEDSTALQKHPTLPDTEGVHEVRPGFSPTHTHTQGSRKICRSSLFRHRRRPEPHGPSMLKCSIHLDGQLILRSALEYILPHSIHSNAPRFSPAGSINLVYKEVSCYFEMVSILCSKLAAIRT